jgi:hypothetical protein
MQKLLQRPGIAIDHDEERAAVTKKLEKLIKPPGFSDKAPGRLSH